MNQSFDLLQAPWIPCMQADGAPVELGLRDTLAQAHNLRELHGESPLVTAALYRLLLAVLHRVFGPAGYAEWAGLWQTRRWDPARLDAYLERWRSRFNLFDPQHPFYQAPDARVKPKPVNSLILDAAFGNKATLFDHHTDAEGITLSPAQSARVLITAQAFGLAGTLGSTMHFTDGSCARGILFLVEGETLFETLALNLLRYPDDGVIPTSPDDCPAWEMDDPFTPDRSHPRGYLDYLTWQSRRIMLLPEATQDGVVVRQMTLAPALRLSADVLDPMKHYRRDEKRGPLVLRFNEERALWRDSAALFRLSDEGYRAPRAFWWLAELIGQDCLPREQPRRYLALGMANDQARVDFYRSEHMPLLLDYLQDKELVDRLDDALKMAEAARSQLWGAAYTLATFLLSPHSDTGTEHQPARKDLDSLTSQWAIERDYWSRLEIHFHRMLVALPNDVEGTLADWRETLRRTAQAALNRVATDLEHDSRNLKATVRARDQLKAGLRKILPD